MNLTEGRLAVTVPASTVCDAVGIPLLGGRIELDNALLPPWALQQADLRKRSAGVRARILLPRAAPRV